MRLPTTPFGTYVMGYLSALAYERAKSTAAHIRPLDMTIQERDATQEAMDRYSLASVVKRAVVRSFDLVATTVRQAIKKG